MAEDPKDEENTAGDKTSVISSDTFKGRLEEATNAPPSLVLLVGPNAYIGKQWPLTSSDMVVGRDPRSHVFVDDKSVSKSHAKVIFAGVEVSIMDLESTNKTVINGRIVPPLTPVKLKNNDQIKTGNVIFKFLESGNIESMTTKSTYDRGQIDGLTQIFNKAALLEHGKEAFKRSGLMQFPLTVMVFDLDHFRQVNNNFGHLAGDYVLKILADLIKAKVIRGDDFFARFGGEEFVVILHGSGLQQGADIAERARQAVQTHDFTYEGKKLPITISLGVAEKSATMTGWDDLFKAADEALYRSKNNGRNQVTKYKS